MLKIENLSVYVQNQQRAWRAVVDQFNLSIEKGEILGLIGESGSGKSMTAQAIMRLLPNNARYSAASKVLLYGEDILNLPEKSMRNIRGADVAMIFQDPMGSLNPVLKIGFQIVEVLRLHRQMRGRYAYIEALRLLDAVKIKNPVRCFDSFSHELSGGMQQRVMIAIALACKPSLLIADEATTSVDVTTQAQILSLLKELREKENMAILLITHDLSVAARMADRIAVMQDAHLIEDNIATKFFLGPTNQYSKQLLASLPSNLHLQHEIERTQDQVIMQIKNLRVYFPIKQGLLRRTVDYVRAVDEVDLSLRTGRTLAVVGESGSGKSTLAKAVLALLNQTKGEVLYADQNILAKQFNEMHKYRSAVQIIFQNPSAALNPKLKVVHSLEEGMVQLLGLKDKDQRHVLIDQLLIQVGLKPEHKWRYPHEFSGGERQRVCIARALSVNPKVVVCDEPTSSLDVSVQAQVLRLLQNLQNERQLTYLFITHDLRVVEAIAHDVAVMKAGKIVEYGIMQQVMHDPQHEYTKQLLAASKG